MEISLNVWERLILANQYAILERLDNGNACSHRNAREIVERGYEHLYDTLTPLIETEVLPNEVSREVYDILDMFRAIEQSMKDMGKMPSEFGSHFDGFELNSAPAHHDFSKFVRRSLGYWQDLSRYPDTSQDASSLFRYRAMLLRWKSLGAPFALSAAQIVVVSDSANTVEIPRRKRAS